MRLYHFLEEKYALDDLINKRLKISIINQLNDPFEHFAINLRDPYRRKLFTAMKDTISETRGLICFSKTWHNPMLWSHYADKHKGICLAFDIPNDGGFLHKVIYTPKRIDVDGWYFEDTGRIDHNLMYSMLNTKSSHWRYENEYRVYLALNDATVVNNQKMFFADFGDHLKLAEVLVGCRSQVTRLQLTEAIGDLEVPIRKTRMAFNTFKIVTNRAAW